MILVDKFQTVLSRYSPRYLDLGITNNKLLLDSDVRFRQEKIFLIVSYFLES